MAHSHFQGAGPHVGLKHRDDSSKDTVGHLVVVRGWNLTPARPHSGTKLLSAPLTEWPFSAQVCPSPQSPLLGSPIPPELSAHGAPCQFQPSVLTTLYSSASVPNRQPQRASHWPNPATGRFPSDLVYPARQLGRAMGLQQQDLWGGHWGR